MIIRAGALLPETKTLLAYWDEGLSTAENLHNPQLTNIFGKASRAWVKQFPKTLQERYFYDEATAGQMGPILETPRHSICPWPRDDLNSHEAIDEAVERQCRLFDANEAIRMVFSDARISPWCDRMPEANSRAAELGLEPDLNDGVALNIAPLWELVPWREAQVYWEELLAGTYEWSAVRKQLRERGLVR